MKLAFISNYYNHHQKYLCDAFCHALGDDFSFIACSQMREERKKMGYEMQTIPDYVYRVCDGSEAEKLCKKRLREADVLLLGAAPAKLVIPFLYSGKPVFRYSERPLKKQTSPLRAIPRWIRWHFLNPSNVRLLAASAYAKGDFSKYGLFRNKSFRWGYFPETVPHELPELFASKEPGSILWCGRFLDWKHPDDAILAAAKLKELGTPFHLNMIGGGELEDTLKQMIREHGLEAHVSLLGRMKPAEVRRRMEQSSIFMATSDYQEGWGVVVNEAMNSGCAVVASEAMGSVPYLMTNGENGLTFPFGENDMLLQHLISLLNDGSLCRKLGEEAYHTITNQWNEETAAHRFLSMANAAITQETPPSFASGPCSRTE